jgi:hypothetical protein
MGLYDDDKKSITSGDILDVCYWQTKFAYLKFEAALASRQPETPIRLQTADVVNSTTDVLKEYPNHEDLKKWKAKAEDIAKKIDPNAVPADWKSNFAHWKDYSYEAGWRSYHIAKMAAAADDWGLARSHADEAVTQLTRTVARMEQWPADVQAWVNASKAEMEKLAAEARTKK